MQPQGLRKIIYRKGRRVAAKQNTPELLRQTFVKGLQHLAFECGKELSTVHFRGYVLTLQQLDLELGIRAIEKEILNRRDRDPMPTPRELLVKALELSDGQKDLAGPEEIASRIIGAVRKFGSMNYKDAEAYIGEIGWNIVKTEGGWSRLCMSLNDFNLSQNRAHWTKLARSQLENRAEALVQKALAGPQRLLGDIQPRG